nr:uncharacterized protein LOC129282133 [Lytechinus pictus]
MDPNWKAKLDFCTEDECLDRCGVNSEITRLCELLPDGYNYTVCQFDIIDEGITALLRLDIKTECNARTWLRLFQEKTRTNLRLLWTGKAGGQKNIFSAHYRCQHGSFRKSRPVSSSSRTKITNCPATLGIAVKRVPKRNRSMDIHIGDLPTVIRLSFTHNHPVTCVKASNSCSVSGDVTEIDNKPVDSGHTPSAALHAHKFPACIAVNKRLYSLKRRSNQLESKARTKAKIICERLVKSDAPRPRTDMSGAVNERKQEEIKVHEFAVTGKMKVTVGEISEADVKTRLHERWKSAFGDENEAELVRLILDMEPRGFILSRLDVRRLGYQFAESKDIEHIFDRESGLASEFWIEGFLIRHPDIVLGNADSLSQPHAPSLQEVTRYFDRLGGIMDRESLHQSAEKIYNVDECSLTMMNHSGSTLVLKGMKLGISETNSENSVKETVVVVCCSATGQYIPPFIILNGKKREEFSDGLPDISSINEGSFLKWLKLFRKHAVEGKVLLIIDGLHKSYVKSVKVQRYCTDHDIILFCLPGRSKAYLQPLNQCVINSLQDNWEFVRDSLLHEEPQATITEHNFSALFAGAWRRTASVASATLGFRACGIHPFNPVPIPSDVSTPSRTTERESNKVIVKVKEEEPVCITETQPDSPVVQERTGAEYAAINAKCTVETEASNAHMSSSHVVAKGADGEPLHSCGCCGGFTCSECDQGWIAC